MGCDIHTFFETTTPSGWRPLWQPVPHPEYWYENILETKIETGAGMVLTGNQKDVDPYDFLEKKFQKMSIDEIIETYGNHPDLIMMWPYPKLYNNRYCAEISDRNYDWFEKIAGVRGDNFIFSAKNTIPSDSCLEK